MFETFKLRTISTHNVRPSPIDYLHSCKHDHQTGSHVIYSVCSGCFVLEPHRRSSDTSPTRLVPHSSLHSHLTSSHSTMSLPCALRASFHRLLFATTRTSPHYLLQPSSRYLHQTSVLGAGHSKWQNIKHTKAAKDQQKSQLYNRLIVKIKNAVGKQGGADPRLNKEFADVIEMCRKLNMPGATIDKAVKRAVEKRYFEIKMEIIGPENSLLVIEAEVENKNFFKNEIRKVLKKYVGFGFANEGRALSAFEEKGVVRVRNKEGSAEFDLNKAEEVAIEADAEEVRVSDDDDTVLMFIGDQLSHTKVKGYIEANLAEQYVVIENGVELLPYVRSEISDEAFTTVANAIELLGELEGVNRVYSNL